MYKYYCFEDLEDKKYLKIENCNELFINNFYGEVIGLFGRKKYCPPPLYLEDYRLFWSLPPWISSRFFKSPHRISGIFPLFFCIDLLEIHVFHSTPWNFPLISLTGGGVFFCLVWGAYPSFCYYSILFLIVITEHGFKG